MHTLTHDESGTSEPSVVLVGRRSSRSSNNRSSNSGKSLPSAAEDKVTEEVLFRHQSTNFLLQYEAANSPSNSASSFVCGYSPNIRITSRRRVSRNEKEINIFDLTNEKINKLSVVVVVRTEGTETKVMMIVSIE